MEIAGETHPFDPFLPVTTGRFRARRFQIRMRYQRVFDLFTFSDNSFTKSSGTLLVVKEEMASSLSDTRYISY
jgi:hypothetical protein